ncbi:MAG: Chromosomal replication initiator protein DnaA, partial [uncultured Gemmatimonadetes bacterium]
GGQQQPAGGRRGARGGRGAGARVQPAVHLRRRGAGQDAPDARHRARHAGARAPQAGAVHLVRALHQRAGERHPGRDDGRVPAAVPADRPAAGGRHPVPGGQGAHAGRVLPHLQRASRRPAPDRPDVGPAAQRHGARGPPGQPLRMGAGGRHQAARLRNAHRHPSPQGGGGPAGDPRCRRRAVVHRAQPHLVRARDRGRGHQAAGVFVAHAAPHRPGAGARGAGQPAGHRCVGRTGRRFARAGAREGSAGVEHHQRRAAVQEAHQGPHRAAPGGDVPDQGDVRPGPGGDRQALRRARPQHGDPLRLQGGGGPGGRPGAAPQGR